MVSIINIEEFKESYYITECEMLKEVNGHGYCKLKGRLQNATTSSIKATINASKSLCLISNADVEKKKVIFVGCVTSYEIKYMKDYDELAIELAAMTIKLDLEEKSRFFSKSALSYENICSFIDGLHNSIHLISDIAMANISHISVQYLETDWNYMRRLVSEKNSLLIPDYQSSRSVYYVGMPVGSSITLKDIEYKKSIDFVEYKKKITAGIDTMLVDEMVYIIEIDQNLNIGTEVTLETENKAVSGLVVYRVESMLKGSVLESKCYMKKKAGLKTIPIKNYNIIGASITAYVKHVEGDKVTVTTAIDALQDSLKKFPFATVYAHGGKAGWYCMPEEQDEVMLYFPNENENEAFVFNAVQLGNMGDNPSVKYFRSPSGAEIEFGPTYLKIASGGNKMLFCTLNDAPFFRLKEAISVC